MESKECQEMTPKDMLEHMVQRNKKFTDFARSQQLNDEFTAIEEGLKKLEEVIVGYEVRAEEVEHIKLVQSILSDVNPHLLNIKKEISNNRERLWLQKNLIAVLSEVGELTHDIPYKWWGRGIDDVDKEHASEEIIDILHFLFSMLDALGKNATGIYNKYIEKNDTNWERWKKKIGWGKKNL